MRFRKKKREGRVRTRRRHDDLGIAVRDRPGLRWRLVDGWVLEPTELPSARGGDRPVQSRGHLEPQKNMVNEECQEFDRGEELVIGVEARVKPRALVVDHAVWAVGQPLEGDGSPLHVREEALESTAILGVDVPGGIDVEARVFPSPHPFHGLGADLLAAEHELEESFAEEDFEAGEIDVFHGEEDAVGTEEAERADGVGVGMKREEVPVTLGGDDHGRDGFPCSWERACALSEEVAGGGVRDATELSIERSIEEEGLPQCERDGEDELAVFHARKHALDHSLGPLDRTALRA